MGDKYEPPDPLFQQFWDPKLGYNINPGDPGVGGSAQAYIQANPTHYQGYTGQVQAGSMNGSTTGPTADAIVPGVTGVTPPPPPPAGNFDPYAYQVASERSAVGLQTDPTFNPYAGSPYGDQAPYGPGGSGTYEKLANTVQRIPGGNPTFGVLPGTQSYYNLLSAQPVPLDQIDPVTQRARAHMRSAPTLAQTGGPGGIYGRGYTFQGGRWVTNPLSGMQSFAQHYYVPAMVAAPAIASTVATAGAAAPAWAPVIGATFGALAGGANTKFQNPGAIAIGGAAGGLAGYGAGALGQALNAGPIVTGAGQGAAGAVGSQLGQGAVTGQVNPATLGRAAAIGAGAGGVTGGIGALGRGMPGTFINTPGEPGGGVAVPPVPGNPYVPVLGKTAGQLFGNTLAAYWPADDPRRRVQPLNPYRTRMER